MEPLKEAVLRQPINVSTMGHAKSVRPIQIARATPIRVMLLQVYANVLPVTNATRQVQHHPV